MHPSVMAYVTEQTADLKPEMVLEVGSYNENGSVRSLFDVASYIGVDTRMGPGVDRVVTAGYPYPFPPDTFDVVISTEMLEHDTRPWRSVAQMARVLRRGGTLILTARGFDERGCYPLHGVKEHGDWWRFSVGALVALIDDAELEVVDARSDPDEVGAFITARKP